MTLPELRRLGRQQARLARHHLNVLDVIRAEIRTMERKAKRRKK